MATRASRPDAPCPPGLVPGQRWRRVFPGEERQLAALRRWLAELLPACEARDDVVSVATELGSNAVRHTASGRAEGWFAVEVTWHGSAVQVAVIDRGGSAEPRVIDDPDGEGRRGLLLVQGLSLRAGFTGDQWGRVVWAQIGWPGAGSAIPMQAHDPCQAAVRDGEAAWSPWRAGVPARSECPTARWARVGSAALAPEPIAPEPVLEPLPDMTGAACLSAAWQAPSSDAGDGLISQTFRYLSTRGAGHRRRRGTANRCLVFSGCGRPAPSEAVVAVRDLAPAGPA